MEFSKPEAFAKQIAFYLKERMNDKAYELCKDFVKAFPGQLLPHVLLAESSFRLERFAEAKIQARKAMGFATSDNDIAFCSMVFSSACFQLKDYIEGYRLLKSSTHGRFVPAVEEALLIFSLAMNDEQKAIKHMKNLMVINRSRAIAFMNLYIRNLEANSNPSP